MCDLNGCGNQSDMPEIPLSEDQRRSFLKGMMALPLATVLAYPELAHAQANSLTDVSTKLADGTEVKAAIALPEAEKAPTVILIHEWWGLNDQIKAVAAEMAKLGYIALAVDLYSGSPAATTPDGAKALMKQVKPKVATETLVAWADFLKQHKKSSGKIATLGWCFGGGWSLAASTATPIDATVIYYGSVTKPADELKKLSGPVLGHFGKKDKRINEDMVSGFEKAMKEAGKEDALTVHWYDADHAFANPTGARYDEANAKLAWQRTHAFLQKHCT